MSLHAMTRCDLAVIGAGAAGLSAALQAATLGLRVSLLTSGCPGGRLRSVDCVPVVEGLPVGLSGMELVERSLRRCEVLGVDVVDWQAGSLTHGSGAHYRLGTLEGAVVEAVGVVVATGVDRGIEDVEGANRLVGRGVYTWTPPPGEPRVAGDVFVAGEPLDAVQVALALSPRARRVVMVTSARHPSRSLPPTLLDDVRDRGNVVALPRMVVAAAEGIHGLEAVVLRDLRSGRLRAHTASELWLVGRERARTSWLPDALSRDPSGRLATGRARGRLASETNWSGVFAAGDARAGLTHGWSVFEDGMDAAEQAFARFSSCTRRSA